MISHGDICNLISWHLSFLGCKRHQAARPDCLVLLCSAMKTGNRPTTLVDSDKFFNLQKGTQENNTELLRKNYNSNKNHMGAARLRPTWCLRSTLSTLQAWKKVQSFCEPYNCFFVCCCLGHVQATPGSPVVRSQALQLSVCTTGLCVAPRTHVTGGRLENPPFYLQSTPKETAVSLGPYNRAHS